MRNTDPVARASVIWLRALTGKSCINIAMGVVCNRSYGVPVPWNILCDRHQSQNLTRTVMIVSSFVGSIVVRSFHAQGRYSMHQIEQSAERTITKTSSQIMTLNEPNMVAAAESRISPHCHQYLSTPRFVIHRGVHWMDTAPINTP